MGTRKPKSDAIDVDSEEPVYQQLARILRQQILSGQLPPGTKLPERWIVEKYQVTRTTAHSTLYLLVAQGLVQRLPRKGAVVAGVKAGEPPFSTIPTILVKEGGFLKEPELPNHWYDRIYAGIQAMARDMGYDLRKDIVPDPVRVPLSSYVPPQPSEAGGVIVYGIHSEQYIGMFRSERVPLVAVDYWTQDLVTDCVTVDVEAEANQVVDLLVQRGHSSLGFVGLGRLAWNGPFHEYDPDIHRMLDDLRRATQRRRVEFRDEWVLLVPSPRQLDEALRGYFSTQPRPTTVLCFDMNVTAGVLKTLADLSLRCPEDISIINRGSEEVAGRPMTSIVGNPEKMGRIAVKLLAERMHGLRDYPVKLVLPSRLVLGSTTGPAPQGG